jgi:hypothetical protein
MWSMNVYSCVKIIFIFLNCFVTFDSLQFYILGYNIISFTIPKDHFLNFEIEQKGLKTKENLYKQLNFKPLFNMTKCEKHIL